MSFRFAHLSTLAILVVSAPFAFAVPAPAPGPLPVPAPAPDPQLLPGLPSLIPPVLPLPTPTCANGPVECCDGLTGVGNLPSLIPALPAADLASLLPISLNSDAIVAVNCQPATLGLACVSGQPFCCSQVVPLPVVSSGIGINCTDAPGIGGILPGLPGLGGLIL